MKKDAYLILTDLHYNVRKQHRLNYFSEVLHILQNLLEINESYKEKGFNTYLILLGDVIDSSLNNADDAMRCVDLFKFVAGQFVEMYSLLGNHEQTNVRFNPFWFMVSELEDSELSPILKSLQPQSLSPIIRVPDSIVNGDVVFHFNHYGVVPKKPEVDGKFHIGLFHQNVGNDSLCKIWGAYDDVDKVAYIRGYSYCFFGHMHLASGSYYLSNDDSCIGEWLGTCVGTNVNEVELLTEPLSVPIVLIEDGKFSTLDHGSIPRKSPKDVINYQALEVTKEVVKKKETVRDKLQLTGLYAVNANTLYDRVRIFCEQNGLLPFFDILNQDYYLVQRDYLESLEGVED